MSAALDMVDRKLERSRQASADRRQRAAGRHLIVEHADALEERIKERRKERGL